MLLPAVAGIVVAVGMMGFAATSTGGVGVAQAAPCPGGGPATCGPTPGPELTFTPPAQQTTAPGQQGQQGSGQDNNGIATSPNNGGGDNGPGIQAQTPQFGTPGQQAPNIPGNEPEQPAQGGQRPAQGNQGQQGQQNPVRTTAPGRPDQNQTGQQTTSGQPSSPTVTVTKTESQCAVPGAGGNGAAPGGGPGGAASDSGSSTGGPDSASGSGEDEEGAPSWAYLVGEVSALMTGRRGRKAGPLNKDGSTPTNNMVPDDQIDGDNYKQWTTADGKRTFILSENADAPSKYRFNLGQPDGGSSKVNDDGSVSVFDRNGSQVNRFDTPWAYDSVTGQKIATRYSVDGNDLVQTIDRPEGNNNPILADPTPEELAAMLRAPTTQGPYTPQQEADRAVAGRIEKQQDIANTIAPPAAASQQPPLPDPTSAVLNAVGSGHAGAPKEPDRTVEPLITAATRPPMPDPTSAVLNAVGSGQAGVPFPDEPEAAPRGFWSSLGNGTKNLGAGVGRGTADFFGGIWQLARHPFDSAKGMAPLVGLGGDGAPGVGESWLAVGKSIIAYDDFARGDYAYGFGKALINIPTAIIGTKGLGAASKAGKAAKAAEAVADAGKDAAKAGGKGTVNTLADVDKAALLDYTGPNYKALNDALRSGVPTADQQSRISAINSALAKLPNFSGSVLRGVDLSPEALAKYQPGQTVRELAFTSTTKNPDAVFPGNTVFQIQSLTGKSVAEFSKYPGEAEVLFPTNSAFQVVSKVFDPELGKTVIQLLQVS